MSDNYTDKSNIMGAKRAYNMHEARQEQILVSSQITHKRSSISNAWVNEMLESVSITDVIENEYDVLLDESANGWQKAPCPLPGHMDSTPSFGANAEKGIFNCFGCGKKGGILQLIQAMEGLNYRESVFRLSEITGIGEGGDESQITRAVRDIGDAIDDYLGYSQEESDLPGGLTPVRFMCAMAVRLREYDAKIGGDAKERDWINDIYRKLDYYFESDDEKSMARLWKHITKETQLRYSQFKKSQEINNAR